MHDSPTDALSDVVSQVSPETLVHETIETVTAGVVLLDLAGRVRYANAAFGEMLGHASAELTNRTLVELTDSEDRDALRQDLERLAAGEKEIARQEARMPSRGGALVWVSISLSLLRRPTGEAQALIGVTEDITCQHVLDVTRRELYGERAALLDSAAEGIYGIDRDGRCTFVNRAAAEMLGYDPAELVGRNLHQLLHGKREDGQPYPAEECPIVRFWRDPESQTHPLRNCVETLWRHDGSQIHVEHSADTVVVDGELRGTVVTLRDVSERDALLSRERRALEEAQHLTGALEGKELALQELRDEQLQLMEAIPQMVWITGPNGEPEYVNGQWLKFTGKGKGNNVADWLALVHPEDQQHTAELFALSMRTRQPFEIEHRMECVDGSYRWVLARAKALMDPKGGVSHWFGTSTDVHERHVAEDLLRRTEKLAAAGRLAATVAHEINNPLEAVGNLMYLAMHDQGLPPSAARYLQMASEELRRVGHIVSQTLGFYRESSQPQPINLGTLVCDVLALYQRKLDGRQIQVNRKIEENVVIEGIAGELRQVLANLLSNALDAMEAKGLLGIEVRGDPQHAVITLSDTGHGIEPPLLERIFEPFFTTKKDAGTGLGLWVSKGIVEKHKGRLEVSSRQGEEDHGTAFFLTLPRRTELRKSA